MDQLQLAKMLEVGLRTVGRWERNESQPTPNHLALLTSILDLSKTQTQQHSHVLGIYTVLNPAPVAQVP